MREQMALKSFAEDDNVEAEVTHMACYPRGSYMYLLSFGDYQNAKFEISRDCSLGEVMANYGKLTGHWQSQTE